MKRFWFYLGILLNFSLIYNSGASEGLPKLGKLPVPQIETLSNGLQIAWFLDNRFPIVDLILLVKSGYRDDPADKTGTAELVSGLLDRGAGGMNAQQLSQAIETLGASRNASVDDDTLSMGMHGLSPDAPVLLDLLARMVVWPEFPELEVKREHTRILQSWNMLGDYGDSLASLASRRLLANGTSYVRGSVYSNAELKKIGRNDVVEFHRKHFTPKNSILLVVGKVDQSSFREKILAVLSDWKGEVPVREWKAFNDQRLPKKKPGILVVDRPNLNQAQVRIGFPAPLIQASEHYSLVVANAMLGEYFNSRLNSLIRDKLGLTYSISSGFEYNKELATFTISSATQNESVGILVKKTIEVLKGLKRGPIPPEELKMAKEYLIGGFPLGTSTLGSIASRWLGGYIFDLHPDYLNEFVPKVNQVTGGDVVVALNKNFNFDQMTVVIAGDAQKIIHHLNESRVGLGPIDRLSLKDLL